MELKFAKTRKGKLIFAFFIVMTVFAVMLPLTTYALNANGYGKLKNVTDPDVFGRVKIAVWYKDIGRAALWKLLVGLAGLVDLFQDAVDTITNLNLYTFIKDQFNIESVVYPIATAVASVAVVFVAVLLIYNADKTRITDFARGIITSLILILALPAMVSALSELRTKGVDYVKESTGDVATSDSEGVYYKETIGQKTLSRYTYLIWESICANQRVSVRGPKETWNPFNSSSSNSVSVTYTPSQLYTTDINAVLSHETLECYVDSYDTASVGVQTKYSELTYEKRRELTGINAYYNDWQKKKESLLPIDSYSEEYIRTTPSIKVHRGTYSYTPFTGHVWDTYYNDAFGNEIPGSRRHWWIYTEEADDFHYSWEYHILDLAGDEVYNKLLKYDGTILNTATIANIKTSLLGASSLSEGLENLDNVMITTDSGKTYSVTYLLNVKNNEALAEKEIETIVDGYNIKKVVTDDEWEDMDIIPSVAQAVKTMGNPIEHIYKYDFDFFWAALELIILALALFFAALKLAGLLYDILFAQIIVPIIVASDMNSSGKAKAAVQNLINTFLIFIIVNLLLRLYILVLDGIQDSSVIGNNILVKIIIVLAGAKFVIDGPDIVTKILGIDAGVKSGLATLMGVRTAVQMGTGAARMAKSAAGRVGGIASGAGAGMVSGGASGFSTSRSTGQGVVGTALNTLGGAVGGAFAGGVSGATGRGNSIQRGLQAGQTAGRIAGTPIGSSSSSSSQSPQSADNHEHSGNSNQSDNNTTGSNGNSSSSGDSSGGGTSGASNESGVSNSTSHVSSDSSAPAVGGAFLGGGGSAVPVKGEKGDKGDKGDKGNDGLQGMQGNRGETGEKGKDAENNAQSGSVNNGSAFSGTWADQQRSAESNSSSWAQQTRSAESSSPTFAEQQHRAEQPTYHAPAPSAPSAPAQPSEPKNHDKK